MYYSYKCPYCGKLFFTEESNKYRAAEYLFDGIKQHQKDYGEDAKEYTMDDARSIEVNQIYSEMQAHDDRPYGHEI